MRPVWFVVGAGALLLSAWAADSSNAPNTLTAEEKRDGWVLLFDGKTMNHWDDPRKKDPPGDAWTIDDGCLKANARPRITEDLFSDGTYRDFDLAFEWRISEGGNSGVKYKIQDHLFLAPRDQAQPAQRQRFEALVERSFLQRVEKRPDHGQDYVIGFEYQMTDDAKNGDAKGNLKHTAGALYDMMAPSKPMSKPACEFNSSRSVVRGK
ncbi:MAG: DUF1080 domain-containing protein, partial [Acidobacteriaceae bacterium]|nr:DUF1080 domain-containing protein [Acidobacteriaceae bacterium]